MYWIRKWTLALLTAVLGLALVCLGNWILRSASALEPAMPTDPSLPASQLQDMEPAQISNSDGLSTESAEAAFPPLLSEPPVASLITVGVADVEGNAVIIGAPGAVEPDTPVYVGSLDTGRMTSTMSLEDGSFSAGLVAPAGAWVLVKQGGQLLVDPPIIVAEEDPS